MKGHQMINRNTKAGFTIVELLIVVVIIAVLAAITIVAYNGMQNRAKNSAAKSTAATVSKKVQTYHTLKGSYPAGITKAAFFGELDDYAESTITDTTIVGAPSAANGNTTVRVETCTGGGVRITPWDYERSPQGVSTSPIIIGSTSGTCTILS